MDKNFEKEVKTYHIEKLKIFPSEMPSSWQMTSIIAEHFYKMGYEQAREEIYKELFRMSLSSNAMDYVRGVGELIDKLKKE